MRMPSRGFTLLAVVAWSGVTAGIITTLVEPDTKVTATPLFLDARAGR